MLPVFLHYNTKNFSQVHIYLFMYDFYCYLLFLESILFYLGL